MTAERPRYYHRDGTPIQARDDFDDMLAWADELKTPDQRRVAFTTCLWGDEVSTVFLGLDHNFSEDGPPLIFETIVFHRGDECFGERSSTEAEARHVHEHAVSQCLLPLWLRKRLFSGWY